MEPNFSIAVSTELYPLVAMHRACYFFIDRCWIWISPNDGSLVNINFLKKDIELCENKIKLEFSNELIEQAVRYQIDQETGEIREAIISAALKEALPHS